MRRLMRFIIPNFWFDFTSEAVSILMCTEKTLGFGTILTTMFHRIHREWTKLGTFRTVNRSLAFRS